MTLPSHSVFCLGGQGKRDGEGGGSGLVLCSGGPCHPISLPSSRHLLFLHPSPTDMPVGTLLSLSSILPQSLTVPSPSLPTHPSPAGQCVECRERKNAVNKTPSDLCIPASSPFGRAVPLTQFPLPPPVLLFFTRRCASVCVRGLEWTRLGIGQPPMQ